MGAHNREPIESKESVRWLESLELARQARHKLDTITDIWRKLRPNQLLGKAQLGGPRS